MNKEGNKKIKNVVSKKIEKESVISSKGVNSGYNLSLSANQLAFLIEVVAWQEQALIAITESELKDEFLKYTNEIKGIVMKETNGNLDFYDNFINEMNSKLTVDDPIKG